MSYNTLPNGQVTQSNGSNVTHRVKGGCYNDFSPNGSTSYVMDAGVYSLTYTTRPHFLFFRPLQNVAITREKTIYYAS